MFTYFLSSLLLWYCTLDLISLQVLTRAHEREFGKDDDNKVSVISSSFEVNSLMCDFVRKQLNAFEFIKAVSDTVLDMINAIYSDKPLISIGLYFPVYQGCF